ncbi:hypothetical protein BJ508DRAFT_302426 [Ascobolus immersus RN42]|uniref:Uncharacterized protein n=1 Tax=Ascobolus immersus RN42 TaxID=1160509 RepID=A0A3N4IIU1_ASCIM|nr:hypothetical protein BJ508DRAFT_302426 [Ascobolus immersus RN42]
MTDNRSQSTVPTSLLELNEASSLVLESSTRLSQSAESLANKSTKRGPETTADSEAAPNAESNAIESKSTVSHDKSGKKDSKSGKAGTGKGSGSDKKKGSLNPDSEAFRGYPSYDESKSQYEIAQIFLQTLPENRHRDWVPTDTDDAFIVALYDKPDTKGSARYRFNLRMGVHPCHPDYRKIVNKIRYLGRTAIFDNCNRLRLDECSFYDLPFELQKKCAQVIWTWANPKMGWTMNFCYEFLTIIAKDAKSNAVKEEMEEEGIGKQLLKDLHRIAKREKAFDIEKMRTARHWKAVKVVDAETRAKLIALEKEEADLRKAKKAALEAKKAARQLKAAANANNQNDRQTDSTQKRARSRSLTARPDSDGDDTFTEPHSKRLKGSTDTTVTADQRQSGVRPAVKRLLFEDTDGRAYTFLPPDRVIELILSIKECLNAANIHFDIQKETFVVYNDDIINNGKPELHRYVISSEFERLNMLPILLQNMEKHRYGWKVEPLPSSSELEIVRSYHTDAFNSEKKESEYCTTQAS